MAYYSVAHVLQQGDIYGQAAGPIAAADMTPEVGSDLSAAWLSGLSP